MKMKAAEDDKRGRLGEGIKDECDRNRVSECRRSERRSEVSRLNRDEGKAEAGRKGTAECDHPTA